MLETRYGELDPWGNYGQYRLLFSQVFCDDRVSGETKDPAWNRGLGVLIVAPVLDFEGPVRPASRDRMDPTVIQSKADEQVYDVRGCNNWVLNDGTTFVDRRVWLSISGNCSVQEDLNLTC